MALRQIKTHSITSEKFMPEIGFREVVKVDAEQVLACMKTCEDKFIQWGNDASNDETGSFVIINVSHSHLIEKTASGKTVIITSMLIVYETD